MPASIAHENEIVARLVAGDDTAFEALYRKHNAAMVRFATSIVASRATAEEVVQDSWLAVLKNIAGFEGRASLAGWMFTIVANKARSRAKRDGRTVSFDAGGEENTLAAAFDGRGRWKDMPEMWDELTPERILSGRSALEVVNAAIDALPANQKAVIVLRGQQQLDPSDVCAILSITEGNMRVLLHRARLAVRAALEQNR